MLVFLMRRTTRRPICFCHNAERSFWAEEGASCIREVLRVNLLLGGRDIMLNDSMVLVE